jgi:hypothetical protein
MKFVRRAHNITLTFTNGYLSKVEQLIQVAKDKFRTRTLKPKQVRFLYDMSVFFKTTRLPIFELMQWIKWKNEVINIEMVDEKTIKIIEIKL